LARKLSVSLQFSRLTLINAAGREARDQYKRKFATVNHSGR